MSKQSDTELLADIFSSTYYPSLNLHFFILFLLLIPSLFNLILMV